MVLKMDPVTIRFECLKLSHRHDLPPEAIVARAKEFEDYVAGSVQAETPKRSTLTTKPKPVEHDPLK